MNPLNILNKAKNMKNTVKKAIKRIGNAIAAIPFIIKLFAILSIISAIAGLFDMVIEWITGKNNPKDIYETLEVEDVSELVEIKEAPDGSYYLDFVDNFDEKAEKIVKNANKINGLHKLPTSTEFIKKLIKAEVVTQFPNLGGTVPEDTDGFQGAVDIVRVMPDKDIGSLDSPGQGETSNLEPTVTYDTVDPNNKYEIMLKGWQQGQQVTFTKDAFLYEEQDVEVGEWDKKIDEKTKQEIKIKEGTQGTYTGKYKRSVQPLTHKTYIYAEIQTKEITGFVIADTIQAKEENQNSQVSKITKEVTSRAGDKKEEKTAGNDENEEYVIAIGAGHNNNDQKGITSGNLKEEELTIKVAEKVQELFKDYKNVTIEQVGSTSIHPDSVKDEDRIKLAEEKNPNLCIQIHFGSGESGVQTIYRDGDEVSGQLAEILSEKISKAMGLNNKGKGTDIEKCNGQALGIIENSAISRFPSVVVEGGAIDVASDAEIISKDSGIENYAKGIVDGILEYLVADHSGYTATKVENQTSQESIKSNVYKLKYVKPEKLEELLNGSASNKEAYKVYTIDENNNIITLSWNMKDDGTVELKKNTGNINLKTALQKYIMPFEYLLYFYIDTNETSFSEKLADEVINNTEIVLALQENISTVKTDTDVLQKKVASEDKFSDKDWKTVTSTKSTVETCTTSTDITYINTWCVKYYKESSFSDAMLDWTEGETEKLGINIKGKAVSTPSNPTFTDDGVVDSDEGNTGRKNDKGEDIKYSYNVYQQTVTNSISLSINYESQDGEIDKKESGQKFIKAYKETEIYTKVRPGYLFRNIENNERTANLLDLTKYLIFMATGTSYDDIKDFDFSEYNMTSFSNVSGIYGSNLEEKVWWALINAGYSKESTAGVMGNFFQESVFKANCVQGDHLQANPAQYNQDYTNKVNSGEITREDFINNGPGGGGYGLAQWTSSGRKAGLYDYAKSKGVSIDDENMQIEYLLGEMAATSGGANGYATAEFSPSIGRTYFINATTPAEAADAFFKYFERAGDSSGLKRQTKAKEYFNLYKDKEAPTMGEVAASSGDGYSYVYTSSTGRKYKEYKQWWGSYANRKFEYYGKTIAAAGCSITSVATVTSGYNNNQTPGTLASAIPDLAKLLTSGGAQCSGYEGAEASRLTSGNPAVVSISGTLETERGSKYYGGHYIAILDARNGNEVYVSDVGANDIKCGGWTNVQNIIRIVNKGVLYVTNR